MLASSVTANPYSPPVDEGSPSSVAAPAAAQVQWFSPVQVGVCTLFGGPLAGTALLWMNARAARWGRQTEIYLGMFAVAALLIIEFAQFTRPSSNYGLGAVAALALHGLAKLQLASYPRERPRPSPRRGWILLGVVAAAIGATFLLAVLVFVILKVVAPGFIPRGE